MKELRIFDYRTVKNESKPNRIATRAVILRGDNLLMAYLKKTDEYKFPGGGMEPNESYESTMIRETKEETGAIITNIIKCLGYIDQIYPDKYDSNSLFHMRSIYYLCDIDENLSEQELSKAEMALDFVAMWVPIDEAIATNQKRIDIGSKYHWTERELYMLQHLKNMKKIQSV